MDERYGVHGTGSDAEPTAETALLVKESRIMRSLPGLEWAAFGADATAVAPSTIKHSDES